MGEDMLRAAEKLLKRNNSSVHNNNYNSEPMILPTDKFMLNFVNEKDLF